MKTINKRLLLYLVFPFAVLWMLVMYAALLALVLLTVCVFSFGLVGFALGGAATVFPLDILASDLMPATMFLGGAALLALSGITGIFSVKLGQAGGRFFLKFRSFSEDARCTD